MSKWLQEREQDKPSRVIHAIAGGDTNLKQPYIIAFVVSGARRKVITYRLLYTTNEQ